MSIADQVKVKELEQRVLALEQTAEKYGLDIVTLMAAVDALSSVTPKDKRKGG